MTPFHLVHHRRAFTSRILTRGCHTVTAGHLLLVRLRERHLFRHLSLRYILTPTLVYAFHTFPNAGPHYAVRRLLFLLVPMLTSCPVALHTGWVRRRFHSRTRVPHLARRHLDIRSPRLFGRTRTHIRADGIPPHLRTTPAIPPLAFVTTIPLRVTFICLTTHAPHSLIHSDLNNFTERWEVLLSTTVYTPLPFDCCRTPLHLTCSFAVVATRTSLLFDFIADTHFLCICFTVGSLPGHLAFAVPRVPDARSPLVWVSLACSHHVLHTFLPTVRFLYRSPTFLTSGSGYHHGLTHCLLSLTTPLISGCPFPVRTTASIITTSFESATTRFTPLPPRNSFCTLHTRSPFSRAFHWHELSCLF